MMRSEYFENPFVDHSAAGIRGFGGIKTAARGGQKVRVETREG